MARTQERSAEWSLETPQLLLSLAAIGMMPARQPAPALLEGDLLSRNRDVLGKLESRPFAVRLARQSDLPALLHLEAACWGEGLRTPEATLRQRIQRYREGQLVLSLEDEVVGVVYSQRIDSLDDLRGASMASVDALHRPGGSIAQLLAINIDPQAQHQALGDQLLEFMLTYCSVLANVRFVAAITLCRDFDAAGSQPLESYIAQRDEQGLLVDPILRFHELHGAQVLGPVPGYRPADTANGGYGVLVGYDIRSRRRREPVPRASASVIPSTVLTMDRARQMVEAAIVERLGPARCTAFAVDRPLMEMGLDSADLLHLNGSISRLAGVALKPTFFFQHNTAQKIAESVAGDPQAGQTDGAVAVAPAADALAAPGGEAADEVAIIGMAFRLPGGIETPSALWDLLCEGRSAVGVLPEGRWRWPAGIEPDGAHHGIDRGGFLPDVSAFDAPFFRISPLEAESMDPQQRMLMELCWEAIEHGGHAPDELAGSRTGVFIGASGSDYARLMGSGEGAPDIDAHYGTGASTAVLANRLSYFYDLRGPSLQIDTACSSSLVALHEALNSIRSGESAQALVGGVHLMLHPAESLSYYRAGMLSRNGQCRTFDQEADGYVRSEGAIVLWLKPLMVARADGDRVLAVVKGSACRHGGLASGLTVPSPEGQADLLRAAWASAGVDPRAIGHLEAHGTGTSLGDPIELEGLRRARAACAVDTPEARCVLGAVKTNLGHLEAAAGLASVIKAVLCLQHAQLPPIAHFRRLNAHVDLDGSGLQVPERLTDWPRPPGDGPRLVGVSSFGSGGTNAHVVLAEHLAEAEPAAIAVQDAQGPWLFVLSAKTPAQLRAYAHLYLDWLERGDGRVVPLAALTCLTQRGRSPMRERLALPVADHDALIAGLRAFVDNAAGPARTASGGGADRRDSVEARPPGRVVVPTRLVPEDGQALARLWEAGAELDWPAPPGHGPWRIAAPTYPFARLHYWLPVAVAPEREVPPAGERAADIGADARPDAPKVTPFAPIWRPLVTAVPGSASDLAQDRGRWLAIGADAAQRAALLTLHPDIVWLDVESHASEGEWVDRLAAFGELAYVVWIAPAARTEGDAGTRWLAEQRTGLQALFRLTRALLARGDRERTLRLTVATWRTQAVFADEAPEPAHAGVHGFVGALAKECPRWSVHALDLADGFDWSAPTWTQLPAHREGDVLAWREGRWFERVFVPVQGLAADLSGYRQGGVYVVVGGAGGVGTAWTRHVMARYGAQVVWIGRRPVEAIQASFDALAGLSPTPLYVQADAADAASMRHALAQIKRRHPQIHGVIHAATGEFDLGLFDMDEDHFFRVLSAKLDTAVGLVDALAHEPLDFVLFFSSVVALEKSGGLSGYAAGGAFVDALALHLSRQRRPWAVKTVNWGHWDIGTGATISEQAKARLKWSGIVPIRPEEAMQALEAVLASPLDQVALLKSARWDAIALLDPTCEVWVDAAPAVSCFEAASTTTPRLAQRAQDLAPASIFANAALEARLSALLAGLLASPALQAAAAAHAQAGGVYARWLQAGRNLLERRGVRPADAAALAQYWQDWDAARRGALALPDLSAAVQLADVCLRALPDVLSGSVRATEVLFPDASMRRVEGVYSGNAVADFFNGLLADALVAAIERRLSVEPGASLRILEIGAGTGGTTVQVLHRLAPYREHIAEYAYTDISKAFTFHAEERFVPEHPYVRPLLFDVERPAWGQPIQPQRYDLVIATNVLHATRDIRRTLAHAKAALCRGGLLLANEIACESVFAHVTFGLLEGWWLSEDGALRMPGAPGLYPEAWRRVLAQEGFRAVALPAHAAHPLGQQILVAESDGVARVSAPAAAARARPSISSVPDRSVPCVSPSTGPVRTAGGHAPEPPASVSPAVRASRRDAVEAWVRGVVARTLRMERSAIDAREPLESYGIDSILSTRIANGLRERVPEVPSTLLFECQTVAALADHLLARYPQRLDAGVDEGAPPPEAVTPAAPVARAAPVPPAPVADAQAIAVIGMACHFPGADDPDAFWDVLAAGRDCVGEIPAERWSLEGFFHPDPDEAVRLGRSYSKRGAFLERPYDFDPLFFNISPKEAASIDPQERLFLRTAWEALEDAGYSRRHLAERFDRQVGVFAGATRTGFDLFGPELWARGQVLHPHTSFSSMANRISYFLDIRGPSVPVDTMCSSSLTAIHQACRSLADGECRLAIAGGVNLYLHPSGFVGLCASRMLSPDGACRAFGRGANGFVPGEGAGAVLLKPLAQAIADGDRIQAVIRATHINHGGKTNGYTVPNPQAQAELVAQALRKACVNAREVSYIEAHGTGTQLGDPIELSALTQAFRRDTTDNGFCAIGSVKSNIGHLEAAAGIAGLVKVILQMRHGKLAPSLHAAEPNPDIDFPRTPFVVQQALGDWPRPRPGDGAAQARPWIAAVSSFGAGGSNAHVVVQEYPTPERAPAVAGPQLVPLSAKNEERLKAVAQRLYDFLSRPHPLDGAGMPSLADIAYTLQVGREPMDARLAIVADSLEALAGKLRDYLAGHAEVAHLHLGHAKQHRASIESLAGDEAAQDMLRSWYRQGRHDRILGLWTKGLDIDWEALRGIGPDTELRRIGLPTYPFAATAYWLPLSSQRPAEAAEEAARPASLRASAPTAVSAPAPVAVPAAALEVVTVDAQALPPAPTSRQVAIALQPLSSFASPGPEPAGRSPTASSARITLSDPRDLRLRADESAQAHLELHDEGAGILVALANVPMNAPITPSVEQAQAALAACLRTVGERAQTGCDPAPRVLLLTGLDRLLPDGAGTLLPALERAFASCPLPVIAVLAGDNSPSAMRVAGCCDLAICSRDGRYRPEAGGPVQDGTALLATGVAVAEADALDREARAMAQRIAECPAPALAALKRHFTARVPTFWEAAPLSAQTLPEVQAPIGPGAGELQDFRRIDLPSEVVEMQMHRDGVVVVRLCERAHRNMSTPALVDGMTAAFERIERMPECKVVVLTGYDAYFACGGTRQGLLDIQRGAARFTDEQSYRLPLSCRVPVIAAMQGHAIGAGWAMGLFCDWAFYSEESTYQSPYMRFGFTPGAGSTLIFPHRFGPSLGREILITAHAFTGRELKQRGIGLPVLPRNRVFASAMDLAWRLAGRERAQLVADKDARSGELRERLPDCFARELRLHDETFVGNPDVLVRVGAHFHQPEPPTPTPTQAPPGPPAAVRGDTGELLDALRLRLAEELQMRAEDIDPDAAFVDIGLDSIVAVTWVRRINEAWSLSLGATEVYSHPSLTRFARHVAARLAQRPSERVSAGVGREAQGAGEASAAWRGWLRESLAAELLMEADVLDENVAFVDLGLDSITAVTWIQMVNRRFGLSIGATSVYSYPTLAAFERHLAGLMAAGARTDIRETADVAPSSGLSAPASVPSTAPVARFELTADPPPSAGPPPIEDEPVAPAPIVAEPARSPAAVVAKATGETTHAAASAPAMSAVAVIGMAGRFPQAEDIGQFWRNIVQGRDCVSEVPPSRWSVEAFCDPDRNAPGKTVCRRMGLLEDRELFDPLFFNISPLEAECMDPQQRLFLQESWRCIEDAGLDPATLSGSRCGVFVGCAASDYGELAGVRADVPQSLLGESVAMLPARIAYYLDLQGPCLALDTACSSSLVAVASACDSLVLGNCETALAGGVYIINGPGIHVRMSKAGMLSPDGRCYSFDQRGNGFVPGEGVGVLLLKPLESALRDGDPIHAIIRGWGVNQDGRTNGITAPNRESQTRLEVSVYERFGIDPRRIGLVEAHGTGTRLGDPIEFEALCDAFGRYTGDRGYCALGSVKSNIGHLATAAGVVGVMKAALALQHRTLPPSIHHDVPNEHIDLERSPFFIPTQARPWDGPDEQARLAAVSSFGFSGTNAHVVLEEAPPLGALAEHAPGVVLLPFSAASPESLARSAGALADWLTEARERGAVPLADIAHTLQVGRAPMRHRLAVVAGDVEAIVQGLRAYAQDGTVGPGCFAGQATAPAPAGDKVGSAPRPEELAARWVAGGVIDWAALSAGSRRRLHGLPTYPFARERYWLPESTADEPAASRAAVQDRPNPPEEAWREVAVPAGVDWSGRLRGYHGKRIGVIGGPQARDAFSGLWHRLARAAGVDGAIEIMYADSPTDLRGEAPLHMAFLFERWADGGLATVSALAGAGLGGHAVPELAWVFPGDGRAAEEAAHALAGDARFGGSRIRTLGVDGDVALPDIVQRLLREWLSADDGAGPVCVRYDGERRLQRSFEPTQAPVRLIRKGWERRELGSPEQVRARGTALVLVNGHSAALAGRLFRPGDFDRVIVVADARDRQDRRAPEAGHALDFGDPEATAEGAQRLMAQGLRVTHIVDLMDLHARPQDHDNDHSARVAFYQAWVGQSDDIALVHCTCGLQPFGLDRPSLAGAKIAGLLRMLSADYRHVDARCVDVDPGACDDPARLGGLLLRELDAPLRETEICYRGGERFVPVLTLDPTPLGEANDGGEVGRLRADGVYVISGGTRGVGLELARHLAARGATRLVLMGIESLPPKPEWARALERDSPASMRAKKLRGLLELDRQVDALRVYAGPLTDADALERFFAQVREDLGPIAGVVHAAGRYSDEATPGFADKPLAGMQRVWEPKVDGLERLHAVLSADAPDFFAVLISMTALVPRLARGASDYAMANAFADAFVAHHHALGLTRYRAIAWSDWRETGAITRLDRGKAAAIVETFDGLGIRAFGNREGRRLFDCAIGAVSHARAFVGYVDEPSFERARDGLLHARPEAKDADRAGIDAGGPVNEDALVRSLERWERDKRAGRTISASDIARQAPMEQIRRLSPDLVAKLHRLLFDGAASTTGAAEDDTQAVDEPSVADELPSLVDNTVREVLKLCALERDKPFQSYGLDSISATVLATRLEKRLGQPIKPQWLIDFSTVERLSAHLAAVAPEHASARQEVSS
ncbi:SDR family NAD(P)-dependent oxidoreductase [Xanthomonas campestris pv. fici]|uniref:SDR family NAD(P)-dependent oxidoreductase n=1 Tax=Xanthomonas euvesicatoria TaxID=456327 RepID=UPI003557C75B